MSRSLATYSRSRDGTDPEKDERIQRVMKAEGCSAPVAKNLLKYAKLGIGSTKWEEDGQFKRKTAAANPEPAPPKTYDRKAAALEAEKRLRELEEQDDEPDFRAFIGTKEKKVGGLSRLGPVLARQETVDPLLEAQTFEERRKKAEEEKKREEEKLHRATEKEERRRTEKEERRKQEEREARRSEGGSQGSRAKEEVFDMRGVDYESLPTRFPTEKDKKKEKERQQQKEQEENNRRKKKKRKDRRKRGRDFSDEDDDDAPQDSKAAKGRSMSRSSSASPEPVQPKSGSLMSEEQVLKMMRKDGKNNKKSRNSEQVKAQAAERIQKELKEWEARKQENAEFWQAPQFCLCYAAETGKNRKF